MFRRAPVPCRPHAVSELLPPELAMVMLRLRKAGIPCDVHVDQAIAVSLGNEDVGPSARATFPLEASRRAARWLHRSALILFEPNGYSLRYSRRFDPVSVLAQLWRPFQSALESPAQQQLIANATRDLGRRFIIMSQVSWQTMMKEFAAAHVVTGLLPSEDAAAGLARDRAILLGRLARTLRLSDMYAIAEIVERDGTHVQCALASAGEAAELAEAVGANDGGCSGWVSRRSFQFDDAAAKAIERALGCHVPAETLPQDGKPLALP